MPAIEITCNCDFCSENIEVRGKAHVVGNLVLCDYCAESLAIDEYLEKFGY